MRISLIVVLVAAGCGPKQQPVDPGGTGGGGGDVANTVEPVVDPAMPPGLYQIASAGEAQYDDNGVTTTPELEALRAKVISPNAADAELVAAATYYDDSDEDAIPPEGDPVVVDIDSDGAVDLILMPHVFFGPSDGFSVLTRRDGRFAEEFAYPGQFITNERTGNWIVLRYEVYVLAPGEPVIQHALFYSVTDKRWHPGTSLYYAMQTDLPGTAGDPVAFELAAGGTLRTAPRIDDTPMERDEYGEPIRNEDEYMNTYTLFGNAVATYGAGARGVVVSERGDWVFVAMDPASVATANSLIHNMDATYNEDTGEMGAAPQRPASYCGWIESSAIRR